MSGYIDIHCHLTGDEYESVGGVEEVVRRAEENGVERIVCSGFDLLSSKQARDLANRFQNVYFCAGFHPGELKKYREGDLDEIKKLCADEKCIAVGEIGLDYHFDDNPPREVQRDLFLKQLTLADEVGLPVVIHSRDAAQETLEFLRKNAGLLKRGGLMHCYSYSPEMTAEFAVLGLYFSFGGTCTFKNAKKVWESVQRVPVERILSETDCPYLTPVPHRGEFPNQPSLVVHSVAQMATLREISVDEMKKQIQQNAKRLFCKLK